LNKVRRTSCRNPLRARSRLFSDLTQIGGKSRLSCGSFDHARTHLAPDHRRLGTEALGPEFLKTVFTLCCLLVIDHGGVHYCLGIPSAPLLRACRVGD
jgi:hypothetical protein